MILLLMHNLPGILVCWFGFFRFILMNLQPQFLLFDKTASLGFFKNYPDWIFAWSVRFSMLFGSICFGWLYVKLTSWLNHFPVLGKRVF